MIYLISIIFVLTVLVFFHEMGHFMLAKLFGVRVERFSIGFPPRLFGIKIGETDYCISAIPLGGYVKMAGVIDESMDTGTLTGAPDEFASKTWWQKVLILSGGVVMNLILAWILISVLLNVQGEPIIPETTVGYVAESGIAQKAGIEKYDKILKINGVEVHNWNEVNRLYVSNLGKQMDITIERDGKILNITLSKDILKDKNSERLDIYPLLPARVGEILPDSPAAKAGLQRGDRIVAINGQPIRSWEDMTKIVRDNPEKPLDFEIQRGGQRLHVSITPQPTDEIDEAGVSHIVGKIGIGLYYEKNKVALLPAFKEGLQKTLFLTGLNVKALGWLVTGKKSAKEMLGGPIMITKMAGDFAKSGFSSLLELIANLSIMLSIINIIPIPGLDGGHILIVFIEEIRRKPLSTQTKVRIQQVGMTILLLLIVFVMYNDILRLFH